MKDHIKQLKDQIINEEMNDQATLQKVVSKVLKNGDVSIKDKDLQNILTNYTGSGNNTGAAKTPTIVGVFCYLKNPSKIAGIFLILIFRFIEVAPIQAKYSF